MSKKIFITGGTGFFGKSILSMLKRCFYADSEFVILSRNSHDFLQRCPEFSGIDNVRFVSGDVRNFEFPREDFDYVIHAATPAVTDLPPGEMHSIIVDGTARVIEFAKECGAKKLMMTSSGAVYGIQPPELELIHEDYPCSPVTEYGIAKLEAEKMCADSGIYTLLPRCFAFVGPYLNLDIHFAVGNFVRDCREGRAVVIKGDGRPFRSYMYADDLVEWLFAILERGENGRPYNVGSDYGISITDLAAKVASYFDNPPDIKIMGKADLTQPAPRYVPSTARAEKELGLACRTDLDGAIRKTLDLL